MTTNVCYNIGVIVPTSTNNNYFNKSSIKRPRPRPLLLAGDLPRKYVPWLGTYLTARAELIASTLREAPVMRAIFLPSSRVIVSTRAEKTLRPRKTCLGGSPLEIRYRPPYFAATVTTSRGRAGRAEEGGRDCKNFGHLQRAAACVSDVERRGPVARGV